MAIEITVPEIGESITEVFIAQWLKQEGELVRRDENLVELESDKATLEVPSPVDGKLVKVFKQSGANVPVGEIIAVIEKLDMGVDADKSQASDSVGNGEPKEQGDTARVMPAAKRALEETGLSIEEVKPSGPGGRLLKEDVLQGPAVAPETRPAAAGGEEEIVPMSPIRRTIAERLLEAQQSMALLTTFNEVDMSAVIKLRSEYREQFKERFGVKLGFMSFFVKAAVDALKQYPQVNAEIRGDQIVYKNHYDIGIAVGGGKGLVVPVIRAADRLSFAELEQVIADYAERAAENKIDLEELKDGTFTISNGGVYGSMLSTPIVNPPQSAVLGLHAIQDRPMVLDGQVVVRPMMYVALTYDHRIIDGREAVNFLKRIKQDIEEPARMLLEI
jgi:2-oxoglutarate dehydrogenase E2 component (dihydrolipoamide succinyltransferase)